MIGLVRSALHGLVLAVMNIVFILAGYGLHRWYPGTDQVAMQAPLAALLTIAAFWLWVHLSPFLLPTALWLQGAGQYFGAFVFSFAWVPLLFVPVHYLMQSTPSALDNMLIIWVFQVPVNFLAVLIARR